MDTGDRFPMMTLAPVGSGSGFVGEVSLGNGSSGSSMVRRETPPELARVTEEGGALAGLYGENSMLDRSRAVGPEAVAYGDDDERDKTAALDDLLVQSGVAGKSRRKSVADLRPVDLAGVSGVGVDRIAGRVNLSSKSCLFRSS